ncbi:MAG: phage holin family protein [Armatimonadetes bacterium]|nr:phage holin family protein [Armatimonadota bacterium]
MTYRAEGAPDDRSVGELFAELTREMSTLVRQEITLARTEMSQKASKAGKNIGMIAAGGIIAYVGILALVAAVILLLGLFIPMWVSALIVGIVIAAAGGYMAKKGIDSLKNQDLVPRETIESFKEMKQGV